MLTHLFLLLAGALWAGGWRLTQRMTSLRLRYTLNGTLLGLGVGGVVWLVPSGRVHPLVPMLATTLLGTVIGISLGLRRDGTRYLCGRIRLVFREWRWAVAHHRQTSPSAKRLLVNAGISHPTRTLILVYNSMYGMPLPLDEMTLPPGCAITTNRRFWRDAAAVVFHIPTLRHLPRVDRPPGQLWVAWFMESGVQYPILNQDPFMRHFDLTMSFRRQADIWTPYYLPDFNPLMHTAPAPKSKDRVVAFFFSYLGERSGRNTYMQEFIQHIDAHSYGRFLRNRRLPQDFGRPTKLHVLAGYKFNLAYENAIEPDYVTEKFFDPLEVGCVPVYMGAPNVDDYAPGDHCYIHAAHFSGPKELAEYLLALNEDQDAYVAYLDWRYRPLRSQYLQLLDQQHLHPFVRLCEQVQARQQHAQRPAG